MVRVTTSLIGKRIKALREERNLSQTDLARLFGFRDRQTVSAIETGARRVTADELVAAVEKLEAPLDYFTDPFLLAGEGRFSWRQTGVGAERIGECERDAGRWIAAFRALAPLVGREAPLMRRTLALTRHSRAGEAMLAGERFVAEFGLGETPATGLAEVMERELGVLTLMVDTCDGISGAACRLPELDAVLVARREAAGHRHFNLAHELFHVLTWDAMPPGRSEAARETGGDRVERLANHFAAAALMPAGALERFGDWSNLTEEETITRLNAVAGEFRVTPPALRRRLVALGMMEASVARSLPEAPRRSDGPETMEDAPPAPFSRLFVEVLGRAIDGGHVSIRRVAGLLELTVEGLTDLFAAHGVAPPADL